MRRGGGEASNAVLGLVLRGAEVTEGGMAPAGVIEAFDEGEDRLSELRLGGPAGAVEQFGLQGREERLRQAVVQCLTG